MKFNLCDCHCAIIDDIFNVIKRRSSDGSVIFRRLHESGTNEVDFGVFDFDLNNRNDVYTAQMAYLPADPPKLRGPFVRKWRSSSGSLVKSFARDTSIIESTDDFTVFGTSSPIIAVDLDDSVYIGEHGLGIELESNESSQSPSSSESSSSFVPISLVKVTDALWKYDEDGVLEWSRDRAIVNFIISDGNAVYIFIENTKIEKLDKNGNSLWTFLFTSVIPGISIDLFLHMFVFDSVFFVLFRGSSGFDTNTYVFALNPSDGTQITTTFPTLGYLKLPDLHVGRTGSPLQIDSFGKFWIATDTFPSAPVGEDFIGVREYIDGNPAIHNDTFFSSDTFPVGTFSIDADDSFFIQDIAGNLRKYNSARELQWSEGMVPTTKLIVGSDGNPVGAGGIIFA